MSYAVTTKEASGLGDIGLGIGRGFTYKEIMTNFNLFVKLPTGDDEKMVDNYLVPLGTGSIDWILNLSVMKTGKKSSLIGTALFKINGSSEMITEIIHNEDPDNNPNTTDIETINYDITNGNMCSLNGRWDYFLNDRWTAGGAVVFSTVGEGSTDAEHSYNYGLASTTQNGISNRQDLTLIDIVPMLSCEVFKIDWTGIVKIPAYTQRHEGNIEEARGLTILFKLSRSL
jgi:hypothetical protein